MHGQRNERDRRPTNLFFTFLPFLPFQRRKNQSNHISQFLKKLGHQHYYVWLLGDVTGKRGQNAATPEPMKKKSFSDIEAGEAPFYHHYHTTIHSSSALERVVVVDGIKMPEMNIKLHDKWQEWQENKQISEKCKKENGKRDKEKHMPSVRRGSRDRTGVSSGTMEDMVRNPI